MDCGDILQVEPRCGLLNLEGKLSSQVVLNVLITGRF